jgi:hypothetical protein
VGSPRLQRDLQSGHRATPSDELGELPRAGHVEAPSILPTAPSWKVKRVRANPHCAVAICDAWATVSSEWIQGSAHVMADPERENRAFEAESVCEWRKASRSAPHSPDSWTDHWRLAR